MKFVVVPMGSAGDVHPMIGVAKALEGRGHEVVMVVQAFVGEMARRAGLRTVVVGDREMQEGILRDPDLWHPRKAFGLIAKWIPVAVREMMGALEREIAGGEAVMVAGALAFGARALAEARGVRLVTVHLQPVVMMSVEESPVMMAGGEWLLGMPRWVRRGFFAGVNWKVDRMLRGAVNEIRREAGVRGARGGEVRRGILKTWWNSPEGVVCLFPEWYARKAGDWPGQAVVTRFALYDEGDQRAGDEGLEAFLAGGERPVVITPGSANVQAQKFLAEAIEGVRRLGRRAVVVTRTREHLPAGGLPEGMLWREYVPFGRVFPRAGAVVHHGGIGTVAQCLAAGVPQLIMPMAHDQPDNAWRVKGLGCGDYLYPKKFCAEEIGRVLGGMMGSESVRKNCARVRELMREQMPMAEVAGIIEGMCGL